MFRFPNEEARIEAIKVSFADRLDFADDFCKAWLEAPRSRWFSGLSPEVRELGTRIATQAFRQFRSVVEECRRGEGFCGDIIGRSLFETTVAIGFLTKPIIAIELKPILDKQTKQHLKTDEGAWRYRAAVDNSDSPDNRLTREFREKLYRAHDAFSNLVFFERLAAVPDSGDRPLPLAEMLEVLRAEELTHTNAIGAEWAYVLKDRETYSGLGIAETTAIVCPHLVYVYNVAFKGQCTKVHAAGALNIREWFSSDDEINGTLRVATMLMLRQADLLQKHLEVNESDGIDLEPWLNRFMSRADGKRV